MKTTTKIKSFVKEFTAVVKGDDTEALGQKVFRQADSKLNSQIAQLRGDLISKEDALEEAKDNLRLARVNNGKLITNDSRYVENLMIAQNDIFKAEEALESLKTDIVFLETQLAELSLEVEA